MKAKSTTEDILAGLELAVYEVLKPENLNVWISVRQRSITSILKENGVDVNFSSAFLEELRNVGLVETDSCGVGLKYKVNTLNIPDIKFLVQRIYDNHKARRVKGTVNDGYPTSSSSDLRPMRHVSHSFAGRSGAVKIIPHEVAKLGDIGYILEDNQVKEVMVIGIQYDPHDRARIVYTVESCRRSEEENKDYYTVSSNIPRGRFYKTIEEVVRAIPIQKYVKRK